MRRALLPIACVACAACGRGSDGTHGGGGAELPSSGSGPFRKIVDADFTTPLEEPFVITELGVDLTDPAPLDDDADGEQRVRVYYARGGAIYRSDLPEPFVELPADPVQVLAASEAWEAGELRAPAIVDEGQQVILYYEGGEGGIGRAVSDDRGETFVKTGMVLAGATSPAAIRVRDAHLLYHTRPDAPGIYVATSFDGATFSERSAPVLAVGAAPAVAGGITAAGATRIALYVEVPGSGGSTTIAIAASADGATFEVKRDPLLDPGLPSERTPGVLLRRTEALLFYGDVKSGKLAIAVARSP